eukprot:299750-Rhodomonas_salina.1
MVGPETGAEKYRVGWEEVGVRGKAGESAISLRACYAMSGTAIAYAATVPYHVQYWHSIWYYDAMPRGWVGASELLAALEALEGEEQVRVYPFTGSEGSNLPKYRDSQTKCGTSLPKCSSLTKRGTNQPRCSSNPPNCGCSVTDSGANSRVEGAGGSSGSMAYCYR